MRIDRANTVVVIFFTSDVCKCLIGLVCLVWRLVVVDWADDVGECCFLTVDGIIMTGGNDHESSGFVCAVCSDDSGRNGV